MVPGYPKPIKGNWDIPPKWHTGIDAAVYSRAYNAIYLFKESEYIKFTDGNAGKRVEGYPKPILGNWNIPELWKNGINSAIFSSSYNAIYLFREDQYTKFTDGKVDKALHGYPKPIEEGNWDINGLSASKIIKAPKEVDKDAVYSRHFNATYLLKIISVDKSKNIMDAAIYSQHWDGMYFLKNHLYTKFTDG